MLPIAHRVYYHSPVKNVTLYNISPISPIHYGNLYQNGNITERMDYAKVRKLNYVKPINPRPNSITIGSKNFLNTDYNNQISNNNIYQNNTLNQFYNLNIINQKIM